MEEFAYVYILASSFQCLYIEITSKLEVRIRQHKSGAFPGSFSDRYHLDKLVYFERYTDVREAIAREKQLKRWSRIKKIGLIVRENPTWRDLSLEWGQPVEPFRDPGPPTSF